MCVYVFAHVFVCVCEGVCVGEVAERKWDGEPRLSEIFIT